ncbi:sensor histidine kinase [Pedobacter endophyticus]|uniref:histidine kinase n=1 Tax=Pedobacter endophyticus TaxID=2789740 RepID=A0A7U3Q5A0_9SPHI|nr:ATP-binding protein [Pedobacter endophyticus]QPH38865.1 hypothetical protein IZT61_17630 [Pedobacter endophyticus]
MQLSKQNIASLSAFAKRLSIFLLTGALFISCTPLDTNKKLEVSPAANKILTAVSAMAPASDDKKTFVYLDSAYRTLKAPTFIDLYAKYNFKGSRYLRYHANTAKARMYADSMLYVLAGKEETYNLRYTKAVFFKGDVLFTEMRYNQAFELYYSGREFAMKNLDLCNIFEYTYRIGMVMYKQERYLGAVPYIKRAFYESRYCEGEANGYKVYISRQGYLNTLGICFEKVGMLDSAIYYYRKSLAFIEHDVPALPENARFRSAARGIVYGNLGGVYAKRNQLQLDEAYLKKSIAINDRPEGDLGDARTAKVKLARLYIQIGNIDEARLLYDQLKETSQKQERPLSVDDEMDLDQIGSQYYRKINNFFLAYKYIERYNSLRDSVYRSKTDLMRSDLDAAFRVTEQNYQIALLAKDRQIKKIYMFSFGILSAIAIGVLALALRNKKRLTMVNAEITAQNAGLQMTLKVLELSQKENNLMIKIAAHDLRNPIAAVINAVDILRSAKLPDKHLEILELLEDLSQRSLETIDSLLNINLDTENITKEPVEMERFLFQCVNLLKFKAVEKNQHLELSAFQVVVEVNKEKIWRLFSNLIYNAIKFSPYGSQIKIGMEREDDDLVFFVRDFGIGIPEELQDKIFDIFTEAKRFGTLGEHPVGLGLAISKQIVQAHEGEIWFESVVGEGTTFYVRLPLKKCNPNLTRA